ncbi:multiple monosaccharide ABC transporter permease [Enterococcus sp. RIT-PI-f]|uniref:multiple monosaccharide ABC transporter permease n=1 Tax=Enterococcus sp. RIT-PI-f TaxID=1690244 RepID=UPI0006B88D6F|nr:multiple monosaccharide ABC transporter permease [Enterococcus sp. RIT-PI-f]KPG70687.1 ABC transporter permease [Enterococcus sp. RIT-PI-f]
MATEQVFAVIKKVFQKYSMYFFLVLIMVAFQLLSNGVLLRPLNITNIILQNSYILILAIGMVLLIILGDIDLSIGSVVAFTGALSAIFTINMNMSTPLAILLCLFVGAAIGAFQGFWIAYVKVPAFIATLAGMLIFRGLTIVVLDGKSLSPFPAAFQMLSAGFIPQIAVVSGLKLSTLLLGLMAILIVTLFMLKNRNKKISYGFPVDSMSIFAAKIGLITLMISWFTYVLASYEGFPNVLIILTFLVVVYRFLTNKTTIGRYIYATGGNEKAAALSGVDTRKIKFFMFINMGILSAIAGLIFSARLNAATATAGNGFELDAIAACYIGGASAYGGIGTVLGAIVGGLVMGVLNNGMSLLGIGVDWQQAIKGAVLLFAVAFDIYNKRKAA